jgi:hypothetical protein
MPMTKTKTRDHAIREMRAVHSKVSQKREAAVAALKERTNKKIEDVRALLRKKYKIDVLTTVASGSRDANISVMPSGWPEIDDLITGETDSKCKTIAGSGLGWPRGRIIEVFGEEAVGKTTLAGHIVAAFQKAGEEAAYVDAEHALDTSYRPGALRVGCVRRGRGRLRRRTRARGGDGG